MNFDGKCHDKNENIQRNQTLFIFVGADEFQTLMHFLLMNQCCSINCFAMKKLCKIIALCLHKLYAT